MLLWEMVSHGASIEAVYDVKIIAYLNKCIHPVWWLVIKWIEHLIFSFLRETWCKKFPWKQNFSMCVLVPESWPTLCDPMDCSPPGSSVYGILQARILEWVAISFSRESFWPRDWTPVSCITGRFITVWAIGKSINFSIGRYKKKCSQNEQLKE